MPKAKTKNTNKNNKSTSNTISLAAMSDISFVEDLHKQVSKIIKKSDEIIFDASEAVKITTPCVQIILAAEQTVQAKGGNIKILKPTEDVHRVFVDLGLEEQINEWSQL